MARLARRSSIPARSLPMGIFVGDVAERSREALVTFLDLARSGAIDRAGLVGWVFGPYLDAISIGRSPGETAQPTVVLGEEIAADASDGPPDLTTTVLRAALAIEDLLRAYHAAPDLSVATKLVASGVVEPTVDERAARGYAPMAAPHFPLAVRVLSVTAAELLTRPERLYADLVVTETSVEIAERQIVSGVGMRSRQTEPWTPSREPRGSDPGWPSRGPSLEELVAEADGHRDDDD